MVTGSVRPFLYQWSHNEIRCTYSTLSYGLSPDAPARIIIIVMAEFCNGKPIGNGVPRDETTHGRDPRTAFACGFFLLHYPPPLYLYCIKCFFYERTTFRLKFIAFYHNCRDDNTRKITILIHSVLCFSKNDLRKRSVSYVEKTMRKPRSASDVKHRTKA